MEWKTKFNEVLNSVPQKDYILTTENGDPFEIKTFYQDGKQPILSARAYPSMTVGSEPKWYIVMGKGGLRCILMPGSARVAIKKYGLGELFKVKSLRVIHPSTSQKSLLCEVAEWLD